MLDIKLVREETPRVIKALNNRGEDTKILDQLLKIEHHRRELLKIVEEQRQHRNKLSEEIGSLKKKEKDVSNLLERAKKISDVIAQKQQDLRELEDRSLQELLLIPNIPHESVSLGKENLMGISKKWWDEFIRCTKATS